MSFSAIKSLVDRKKINKLFIQGNTKRYEIDIVKLQKIHPLMEKIFQCLTNIFMSLENKKSPVILLLVLQPDIGQSILITLVWFSLIFVSGINLLLFFSFFVFF